jgi:XTP/dITP diphosphohydrolase
MPALLIATTNPGKLREFQELLPGFPLVLPKDLGLNLEVAETGATYRENAALKARAFCLASGLPTLADDSGLEVEALGGAPGLHSARYSPLPGAGDADRRALLLANLRGKPRPWTACFHAVVTVAVPKAGEPILHFFEGACPGQIIPQERGTSGFGYDPVFLLPELGLTMAELPRAQKNTLSHRARAVQAALGLLREIVFHHGGTESAHLPAR